MKIILWAGVLTTFLVCAVTNPAAVEEEENNNSTETKGVDDPASLGEKELRQGLFGIDVILNLNRSAGVPTPSFENDERNHNGSTGVGANIVIPSVSIPLNWLFPNQPPINLTLGIKNYDNGTLALSANAVNATATNASGSSFLPFPPLLPGGQRWGWYPQLSPGWTPYPPTAPATGWGWSIPQAPRNPGWYSQPPPGWGRPGTFGQVPSSGQPQPIILYPESIPPPIVTYSPPLNSAPLAPQKSPWKYERNSITEESQSSSEKDGKI